MEKFHNLSTKDFLFLLRFWIRLFRWISLHKFQLQNSQYWRGWRKKLSSDKKTTKISPSFNFQHQPHPSFYHRRHKCRNFFLYHPPASNPLKNCNMWSSSMWWSLSGSIKFIFKIWEVFEAHFKSLLLSQNVLRSWNLWDQKFSTQWKFEGNC